MSSVGKAIRVILAGWLRVIGNCGGLKIVVVKKMGILSLFIHTISYTNSGTYILLRREAIRG